ncbi:hypothetical protein AAFF_G00106650 [Aldrovandia affinis]|uniref:Uncharacterized protein n=1 Tax=Aldrovandia affinis TaxID=143900 RepID=A0AAD7WXZ8_9TELE|nr:hypothetical protein AAFF_G00106650 [Aldrovandia affinis]
MEPKLYLEEAPVPTEAWLDQGRQTAGAPDVMQLPLAVQDHPKSGNHPHPPPPQAKSPLNAAQRDSAPISLRMPLLCMRSVLLKPASGACAPGRTPG